MAKAGAAKKKTKLSIPLEMYEKMRAAFAMRLRQAEAEAEAEAEARAVGDDDDDDDAVAAAAGAMRAEELINWYLAQQQAAGTAAELGDRARIARKVLQRIVDTDNMLYYADPAEASAKGQGQGAVVPFERRRLKLNPDFYLHVTDSQALSA
jgi:hypothetical protein